MTTKKGILAMLRRQSCTVAQLGQHVGVTRNAINVQVKQLEAEGLIRRVRGKRRGRPGKPALIYEAAPHSEDISSSAYQPFLANLINVVSGRLGEDGLIDVLEQAGRQMARQAGLSAPVDFSAGLAAAMAIADSLGATTELVPQATGVMIRNYSCPIGTVVRGEQCACRIMAGFFSEATGHVVTEQCQRGDRLICQYLVEPPRPTLSPVEPYSG